MRKSTAILLALLICNTSLFAQESTRPPNREAGSGYSSRDATVFSMMGWGTCLALGIALLCGSLEQNVAH